MEKYFDFKDSKICYHDHGEGFPVMLVHGFAEDHQVWYDQLMFLQNHCRVIIPDLPGSGKSQLIGGVTVTIEDYADTLNTLLEREQIHYCIILGHSMGGYITLAFAEKYPAMLAGYGLVHSTAFADSEEKRNSRKKGIKIIEEYGGYSFLKTALPGLFTDSYKQSHSERVSQFVERGKSFSNEALIQYYNAMMHRPDRTQVLKDLHLPVLFIIGSEDTAAPPDDLLKQVQLPAISHIYMVKGVGHMGMWERPEEVNSHILQFVQHVTALVSKV